MSQSRYVYCAVTLKWFSRVSPHGAQARSLTSCFCLCLRSGSLYILSLLSVRHGLSLPNLLADTLSVEVNLAIPTRIMGSSSIRSRIPSYTYLAWHVPPTVLLLAETRRVIPLGAGSDGYCFRSITSDTHQRPIVHSYRPNLLTYCYLHVHSLTPANATSIVPASPLTMLMFQPLPPVLTSYPRIATSD